MNSEMINTVKIFKVLSDPNRIRILRMLEIRPLCVCEITEVLELANSTVSKHLSILKDVQFILDDKDGKWVNYTLNKSKSSEYAGALNHLLTSMISDDIMIKKDIEKVNSVDRNEICGR